MVITDNQSRIFNPTNRPMQVFILDNEPVRIEHFIKATGGYGHSITLCTTVFEARKRYSPPYDLVLLEYELGLGMLPGTDFVDTLPIWTKEMEGCKFVVHTLDRDGQSKMVSGITAKGYGKVSWFMFSRSMIEYLEVWAQDREVWK